MKPSPILFLTLLLIPAALAGCGGLPGPDQATPTALPATATEAPTPTPLPSPTPTELPPLVVLLAPPEADPALVDALQASFSDLARQAGLRWQVRQSISPEEAASEVDYLIALPPGNGLPELVAAAPQTRFLAVGIPGLETAPNLIAVGSEGDDPLQAAFAAGYTAAAMTPEWRIGMIGVENEAHPAIREAFANGVRFFCGLCRSGVPPFYEYPIPTSLPAGAADAEWRALADFLIDRAVRTVYVVPGAGGEDLLRYLADSGIAIIGGIQPPESARAGWAFSIRKPDLAGVYLEYWPQLLEGNTGQNPPLPPAVTDVNPQLLSPGKQRLAEQILADLQSGYVSPAAAAPGDE